METDAIDRILNDEISAALERVHAHKEELGKTLYFQTQKKAMELLKWMRGDAFFPKK